MTDEQWAAHVRMMRIVLYRVEGGTIQALENATLDLKDMFEHSFPQLMPEWLKKWNQ
jgi:hypothetical protein